MLALVQPMSTQTAEQEISITVEYTPGNPPSFKFLTGSGKNRCLIPDDGRRIHLTLRGAGPETEVKYSPTPILWTVPPLSGGAPPVVVQEGQTISFDVPKPLSYFNPWIFKLSVDEIDGLNGITSPDFFLVLRPANLTDGTVPEQDLTLTYDPQNGEFELDNGMLLRNERVLINTFYPFEIPITVKVAQPSPLAVSGLSIVWASGKGMPGVTAPSSSFSNPLLVEIGTEEEAAGYGQGFRIGVTFDNGQQILSPDPILINATLGDGN